MTNSPLTVEASEFYVRINFIKLILQKIGSSTCKGDKTYKKGD